MYCPVCFRDYSLPGDYRHLLVKPERLSWSLHRYSDHTKSLVLSDLEKLRAETLEECSDGQDFSRFALFIDKPQQISGTVTQVTKSRGLPERGLRL